MAQLGTIYIVAISLMLPHSVSPGRHTAWLCRFSPYHIPVVDPFTYRWLTLGAGVT